MPPLLSGWIENKRLKMVRPYIRGDILDIGCGRAAALSMIRPDQEYVGVELHPEYHRSKANLLGRVSFVTLDLDREPLPLGRRFDTILMLAVVEHLANPDRVLSQLRLLTTGEARVLITTPTPLGHLLHRLGARLGLFWRSAVEEHRWAFSRSALAERLERSGLKVLLHRYFQLGGNQLFVCAISATTEQPK